MGAGGVVWTVSVVAVGFGVGVPIMQPTRASVAARRLSQIKILVDDIVSFAESDDCPVG